jgi:hypothetical protein
MTSVHDRTHVWTAATSSMVNVDPSGFRLDLGFLVLLTTMLNFCLLATLLRRHAFLLHPDPLDIAFLLADDLPT